MVAGNRLEYFVAFSVLILESFAAQKHVIKDNPMLKLYEASQAGDKQGWQDVFALSLLCALLLGFVL